MKNTLELLKTDLIQAKIIKVNESFGFLKFIFLFFKSKVCRIHTFIRLRSKNDFISLVARFYLNRFFIEIGKNTKIGTHFFLPHPRCIIIANNVVIGSQVNVGQYVTIGGSFKKTKLHENKSIQKLPIIGNRVVIAPGAVIGGPVIVGDDVIIGANATVTTDIPSNKIVNGNNEISRKNISLFDFCREYKYND